MSFSVNAENNFTPFALTAAARAWDLSAVPSKLVPIWPIEPKA